jgi:hypothetical protein
MRALLIGAAVLFLASAGRAEEDKIVKSLSPEESEAFLKKFEIDFKKVEAKIAGVNLYDFKRKNFSMRFHNFEGKDIMLDALFPALPLERVNEWNTKAKFTRATLQRDTKGVFVTLESNLDLIGGVTEGGLRQFFANFEDDARLFAKFSGEGGSDDQIFSPVSEEKVDAVLKGLGFTFQKKELSGGHTYDFEFDGRKFKLTNFGGKDLMIETRFKKIPLADVNRYNLEKKFVRAVGYDGKSEPYTSLESNLDCEVGTTVGILRYFLLGFTEDAKNFAKYIQEVK